MRIIISKGSKYGGKEIYVSEDKYNMVKDYDWYIHARKSKNDIIYYALCPNMSKSNRTGRSIYMHRLITSAPIGKEVDHINHNGLDNQNENIRVCSGSENQGNRKKNIMQGQRVPSSQFKGVSWNSKDKIWVAFIGNGSGRCRYIGRSKHEADAARMYDEIAEEKFGKFALLNFPKIKSA